MIEETTASIGPSIQDPGAEDGNTEANRALVKEILDKVKKAKTHHKDAFKRMRQDQELVHQGTSQPAYMTGKKYVANIVQRHVQQRVSALYAKNPQAAYQRRKRRDFAVWDGSQQSLQAALMITQQGIMEPNAIALLNDYQEGMNRRRMLDGLGETLVSLFEYYTDEQVPSFKLLMKQCVRRAVVTGVGYMKLDFQRTLKRNPSVQMHIEDLQEKMDKLDRLLSEAEEGEITDEDAQYREMELLMRQLMNEPMEVDQEGVVFGFPHSTALIVDPDCVQLQGFIGANWIAEEHYFDPDEVREIWGVDLKNKKFTHYAKQKAAASRGGGETWQSGGNLKDPKCCVFEYYDKTTGMRYFVLDGYDDFLEEPGSPNVDVERFFPYYSLVFNAVESEKELYPPSDVRMIKPMQDDHNFAREGLREHRKASRPKYAVPRGQLEDDDIMALQSQRPHHVVQLKGLQPNQKAQDIISPIPSAPIDPNLYITTHLMDDIQITVGAQEANFGAVSKATATETSVAESARMSSVQSNIDDLDDFLSDVARDAGQVMLTELEADAVFEIVGPGAVWPQMTAKDIKREVYLKIEAGSSGRPNKAADLANMERILPYILQMPGVNPELLARETIRRMDDRLDPSELVQTGLPSITALNGAMGKGGAGASPQDAGSSPQAQGQNGGQNQEQPRRGNTGPQPGYNSTE